MTTDNVHATNPSIGQCSNAQTMGQCIHAGTIYQQMFPRINIVFYVFDVFCCADHHDHNENAVLSNANMRKYRPCHAFSTLFDADVKEHIVQNLALSLHPVLPLNLIPVKVNNFGRAETSFLCFVPQIIITGTLCSTMLTCESMGPAMLFAIRSETNWGQTTVMGPQ